MISTFKGTYYEKIFLSLKEHWIFFTCLAFWIWYLGFIHQYLQANIHQDSGISFYTYLFSHHEEFKIDPFAYYSLYWIRGSLSLLIPVFFSKKFNLDASFFEILFLSFQIAFIFIYFYFSVFFFTKSKITSLLSLLLALFFNAWCINLAAYDMQIHTLLYTTIAVGLSSLAILAYFYRLYWLLMLCIVSACGVHPVIGFYDLVYLALLLLFSYNSKNFKKMLLPLTSAILLGSIIGTTLYFYSQNLPFEIVGLSRHWAAVNLHMHSIPWNGWLSIFLFMLAKFVAFILVALLLGYWTKSFFWYQDPMGRSIIFGSVALALLSFYGIVTHSAFLTLLQGFRSLENIVIFIWPYLFLSGYNFVKNFLPAKSFLSLIFNFLKKNNGQLVSVLILLILIYFLPLQLGYFRFKSELIPIMEAQLWTRKNTSPGEPIITNLNWRTISHRPIIRLIPDFTIELYSPYIPVAEYNDWISKLYQMKSVTSLNYSSESLITESYKAFKELDREKLINIGHKYGACLHARRINDPPLDLNIRFQNTKIIIYDVCQ